MYSVICPIRSYESPEEVYVDHARLNDVNALGKPNNDGCIAV